VPLGVGGGRKKTAVGLQLYSDRGWLQRSGLGRGRAVRKAAASRRAGSDG
jgi:hypothetical protein